jgi:hypothetical protein
LNVARQNAQQLVKIMGGEAATGADAHMLKESERSKKFDVEKEKEVLKVQKEERKKEEPKKEEKSLQAKEITKKVLDNRVEVVKDEIKRKIDK